MNGFIRATVAGLCFGTGFTTLAGCSEYRHLVHRCWPERYEAEARLSVRDTFGAQVHDGHVLDQTVWNYHFKADPDPKTGRLTVPTDKLNEAGMEYLKYLVRRQPVPDSNLYLQTAQVVPGAETMAPDKLAEARGDLDNRRVAAIQKYLAGMMSGRSHVVEFQVAIHDPAEVGIAATPIAGNKSNPPVEGSIPQLFNTFKGKLPGAEGVSLSSGGG